MKVWNARVARAVLIAYLFRGALAALLAFPLVAAVGASGIRSFPGGDATLFEPGGSYLIEVFQNEQALLEQLLAPTLALLLVGGLARVMPDWIVLRALRPPDDEALPTSQLSLGLGARAIARLAVVTLALWIARGVLVLVTFGLAMTVRSFVSGSSDERLPTLAAGGAACLGIFGWLCASVWHDVAALGVALEDASPPRAIAGGLVALRCRGVRLLAVYVGTAFAALVLVCAVAALVERIDVAHGGDTRVLGAALAHQLVIASQLALRVVWLGSALDTLTAIQQRAEPEPPGPGGGVEAG
jgi:hypothetical protein